MNTASIKAAIFRYPLIHWLLKPLISIRRSRLKKTNARKLKVLDKILPLICGDPVVKLDEFQGTFSIGAYSDLFARIVLNGHYEPEFIKLCQSYINNNKDIIDIGANIGFYTVAFAKQLNKGKVLAVEPTKNALTRLYRNIERNDVADKVIVYEGVISDHNGFLNIKSIVGKEEYSTILNMDHDLMNGHINDQKIIEEKVSCITLDDLVENYSLNPAFIKMDVEGAEMLVFKGAMATLRRYRPVILSELSDTFLLKNGTSAEEIISFVISAGYNVVDPTNSSISFQNHKFSGSEVLCIPLEYSVNSLQKLQY